MNYNKKKLEVEKMVETKAINKAEQKEKFNSAIAKMDRKTLKGFAKIKTIRDYKKKGEALLKLCDDVIPKYNLIFVYQIVSLIGISENQFYEWMKSFRKFDIEFEDELVDVQEEIMVMLQLNKSIYKETLVNQFIEPSASATEKVLLYKLCATREELDVINNTHEQRILANKELVVEEPFQPSDDEDIQDAYFEEIEASFED